MKRIFEILFVTTIVIFVFGFSEVQAKEINFADSLKTIDKELRKAFPRWRICEPDLQYQLYQAFLILGYDKNNLDQQNIVVLAAPKARNEKIYEILLITCGEQDMNTLQIDEHLGILENYISGKWPFVHKNDKEYQGQRDYCYEDIPAELPVSASQAKAIVNFLDEPSDNNHVIILSLFEQNLKIGNSGFWIRSEIGNDEIGYPFWNAGQANVTLKRPLYMNTDAETNNAIPYLITAYFGGVYQIYSGLNDNTSALSWVSGRRLNSSPGGKIIAGFDFNMPFHPKAGIHLNVELPMNSIDDEVVDIDDYFRYGLRPEIYSNDFAKDIKSIVPLLRESGQVSLFYNMWFSDKSPENYLRFDFGINYWEVVEAAEYPDTALDGREHITTENIVGLKTYKPDEIGDWIYAKIEYRSQSVWPFGLSLQYSNQILLSRLYIPLFGDWLYLDAKYATPLRGVFPYESKNFFMISPVLRITL